MYSDNKQREALKALNYWVYNSKLITVEIRLDEVYKYEMTHYVLVFAVGMVLTAVVGQWLWSLVQVPLPVIRLQCLYGQK
jgi:hypothetical protein